MSQACVGSALISASNLNMIYTGTLHTDSNNAQSLTVPSTYLSKTTIVVIEAFGNYYYSSGSVGNEHSSMQPYSVIFHKSYAHSGIIYLPAWHGNIYGLSPTLISLSYSWTAAGVFTLPKVNNSYFTATIICLG